jgi:membrane protein implicated in regulation of membrane protease activity
MSTSTNNKDNLAKMHYWDVFISTLLHTHESLLLTVLLFVPALLFSPKVIAFPIYVIYSLDGWDFALLYITAILISVVVTVRLKRFLGRQRPKPRPSLTLKPMYFRSLETNCSMPSGDAA